MPSSNNLLTLTAILALSATLPTSTTAVGSKKNLRKYARDGKRLRRAQINHVDNPNIAKKKNGGGGLEEDVEFFTNLIRRTQDMSVPIGGGGVAPSPSVSPPTPTVPTVPTQPSGPTPSPIPGVITGPTTSGPPVPVAGIVCDQGETCTEEGTRCSDGTTETCCGETFDSFVCDCVEVNGELQNSCFFTDACLDVVCDGDGGIGTPGDGGDGDDGETPSPVPPPAEGFNCPEASFVGCTAVDPSNPQDECPTVGEECPGGNAGEFCCRDACPRNYCTAKQAPMSLEGAKRSSGTDATETEPTVGMLPLPDDWHNLLDGLN